MKTKTKLFKSGAFAMLEKAGAWYITLARDSAGNLLDRMRCDDYRSAREYYRAFQNLAKNS